MNKCHEFLAKNLNNHWRCTPKSLINLKKENYHFYFGYFAALHIGRFTWFVEENSCQQNLPSFVSDVFELMLLKTAALDKRSCLRQISFDQFMLHPHFNEHDLEDVFGENISSLDI